MNNSWLSNTKEVYKYQRRQPENSLLYRTIETYWPLFVQERARVNKKLPLFIHQEFDEYLKCGIPEFGFIRTYQWVLSFPFKIRYLLAHNQKLTNEFLKIFIRTIESYQRKRIQNKNAKIGAITFIQRFGSALNLNVHFHTLMTDGVFIPQKDQTYLFQRLPHPTHAELRQLVNKIKIKIERKIQKLNLEKTEQIPFEEESLGY